MQGSAGIKYAVPELKKADSRYYLRCDPVFSLLLSIFRKTDIDFEFNVEILLCVSGVYGINRLSL